MAVDIHKVSRVVVRPDEQRREWQYRAQREWTFRDARSVERKADEVRLAAGRQS